MRAKMVLEAICQMTANDYLKEQFAKMTVMMRRGRTDKMYFFVDNTLILEYNRPLEKLVVCWALYDRISGMDANNKDRVEVSFKSIVRYFEYYYAIKVVMQDLMDRLQKTTVENLDHRGLRIVAHPGERDLKLK